MKGITIRCISIVLFLCLVMVGSAAASFTALDSIFL